MIYVYLNDGLEHWFGVIHSLNTYLDCKVRAQHFSRHFRRVCVMMCCVERGYILGLTVILNIHTTISTEYKFHAWHIQWINANQKLQKNVRHACLFNFDHAIRHSFKFTSLEHYRTQRTFKFSFNLISIRNSNIGRYYFEICHIWLILFQQFLNFVRKFYFLFFSPFKVVLKLCLTWLLSVLQN